jgi:hypothetical protein
MVSWVTRVVPCQNEDWIGLAYVGSVVRMESISWRAQAVP